MDGTTWNNFSSQNRIISEFYLCICIFQSGRVSGPLTLTEQQPAFPAPSPQPPPQTRRTEQPFWKVLVMNVIYILCLLPVLNLFVLFLFNNLIGRSSYIHFYSIKLYPMENKIFVNQMYSKRRDRTDRLLLIRAVTLWLGTGSTCL